MAVNARSKRRSAFGKNNQAKMTAEEYYELIGRHKHIEHKALRQEVAKEFEQISKNRKSSNKIIQSGQSILNPTQPPILPMEENQSINQKFVKSQTWPKLSTIQRCAQMLCFTSSDPELAYEFLKKKINIPPEKLKIAYQVYELMIQSNNYWRKVNYIEHNGKYEARYNSVTRKYALQKAPWTLQIAMTLIDFHLDHIVDIVYLKPLWSLDYDQELERKQQEQQNQIKAPEWNDNDDKYDENDENDESEYDSEEQPIAKLLLQQKQNEDYVNKVADHMTAEQLQEIKEKAQQQIGTSLEDLFNGMFKDMPNVAFAPDFEVDLDDDEDEEESPTITEEYEEEEVESDDTEEDPKLKLLYEKYPNIDRNIIRQQFIQENEAYDATVFQLDHMNDSIINTFLNK